MSKARLDTNDWENYETPATGASAPIRPVNTETGTATTTIAPAEANGPT